MVYVCSVPSERRAKIVFDTPLGLVDGFVSIRHLENLSEQERLQAVRDAESQDEVRSYEGNVLPRTDGYTPVERPTDTPAPHSSLEPTASSDLNATPTPEETTQPTVEPTAEPTTEPTTKPTTEVTTEPTAGPTVEPTAEPTAEPITEPTAEPTAAPTAEPTAAQPPSQQPTPPRRPPRLPRRNLNPIRNPFKNRACARTGSIG